MYNSHNMESLQIFQNITAVSILGLIGFAMLGNLFPGIPEEIAILAIGVAVGSHIIPGHIAFLATLVGLFIIDNILYYLSFRGTRVVMFLQKKVFGKNLDIRSEFIKTHIMKIIFFSRFIVHVRPLGPFLAGVNRVPWKKFVILNTLALSIYIGIMFLIGIYFHSRIERIIYGVGFLKNIILIVLILIILIVVGRFTYKLFMRRLRKGNEIPILSRIGFSKNTNKKSF